MSFLYYIVILDSSIESPSCTCNSGISLCKQLFINKPIIFVIPSKGTVAIVRTEHEMMELILGVAMSDERIRAVTMEGSRANPTVTKDKYQDYDITFYVRDILPFYNNPLWVEQQFGEYLIMQMPEAMRWPDGGGHFNYMMIYPDTNRIDLTFRYTRYNPYAEPSVILLDKDDGEGFISKEIPEPSDEMYHIEVATPLHYYSCCNNFWWCLNNVAKGIARDELAYVMYMLNEVVRFELHCMIDWYIGIKHNFKLSVGLKGKYYSKYLDSHLYELYRQTYSTSNYIDVWQSMKVMCNLFHTLAVFVAESFGFSYRQQEEDGIWQYLLMIETELGFLDNLS